MIGTYSPTINNFSLGNALRWTSFFRMRINEAQKPTRKAIKYSMNIYPIWTVSTLEIGAAPEALSDTMSPAGAKAIRYCANKAGKSRTYNGQSPNWATVDLLLKFKETEQPFLVLFDYVFKTMLSTAFFTLKNSWLMDLLTGVGKFVVKNICTDSSRKTVKWGLYCCVLTRQYHETAECYWWETTA